jgi:hypothetical protein
MKNRLLRWNRQGVPKRWHVKYRRRGITQKKAGRYEEPPMKMEQTGCSETLAYEIQTPGNYPEESIQLFLTDYFSEKEW